MSGRTRAYIRGDDVMYRSVTPVAVRKWNETTRDYEPTGEIRYRYVGPYSTRGPAMASRGPGGWVEVCQPVWEKAEGTDKK